MEAEKKARELVDKMLNGFQFSIDKYTAKQCALIAVDEILELLMILEINNSYYLQVKQEIEKL